MAEARFAPGGSEARVELPGGRRVRLQLRVPGMHNIRNAAAALAATLALGADVDAAARALAEFVGVARRFERLGDAGGVTVGDDFAHHPTGVGAALAAGRPAVPGRPLGGGVLPPPYSRPPLPREALGR